MIHDDDTQPASASANPARKTLAQSPVQTPAPSRTPSPCVKICTLDPAGAFCLGCGRTPAEIFQAGAHMERGAR